MSEFPKLTVKIGGSSGLDIRAMPPEAFWCGEFTLRDDCPQSILIAPWIQFEPVAMAEWRQKWAYEIVRRAEIHETLVATIADLQKTIESELDMAERRYETQQMTYQMWREERAKYGLPEDFSDKQLTDWPPEMLSGYDRTTPRNLTKTPEARAGDCTRDEIVALVAGPFMYHHKMDEAATREAKAFDRCRELTIQRIDVFFELRRLATKATP